MIVQVWLTLFLRSLQIVSEPPSNARSCDTGAPHDVALMWTLRGLRMRVCNTLVPYWKEMNNLHRADDL